MTTLFPDQLTVKRELYARRAKGYKRPLIVAPCGFGKGTLSSDIIHEEVQQGNRNWFIVNRRTLVHDMVKRLRRLHLNPGVVMGAQTRGTHLDSLVLSVDSLRNRRSTLKLPKIAFVDEAHMFMSTESMKLIHELSKAGVFIVNMTATPWTLAGKGLGRIADTMIEGTPTHELIQMGRLAAPIAYAPSMVDMEGVKKSSGGEYDEDEAANVMSTKKLVGDMVKHWHELAYGRKTVGFAVNRKTAETYAEEFRKAGVDSVAVDANTPDKDRDRCWDLLAQGKLMVWSVGIISYGWDVPEVDCMIDAQPTMSLAKALQKWGRPARFCEGKKDFLILDHAGNILRHGMPDDPREWTLRDRKKRAAMGEAAKIIGLPLVCPQCSKVAKAGTLVCQCGYKFVNVAAGNGAGRTPEIDTDATLQRVESRVYLYPDASGDVAKDALIGQATSRNYHPGWINHKTRALDEARAAFRAHFKQEPKAHWSAMQLKTMIEAG